MAVEWMLGTCGVRRGRGAVAVVAQAREPVEVLAAVQVARAAPEGVVAALAVSVVAEAARAEAARERVLRAAASAVEVASELVAASEVAAGVALLEALPHPAATRANG